MSFRSIALASTVFCGFWAGAGMASGQSLEQALITAYETNPTLQAERAELRATDENVPQAKSAWRPTVEFVGTLGLIHTDGNSAALDDTRDFYDLSLQARQNIYNGGAKNVGISQAEANVRAARARLMQSEQQVLLDVVTAYMNVLRDTAVLDLNKRNEDRLLQQLEATQDRFDVGEVTRTDVAQAESRVSRASADRIDAQGNLEVSRAFFEQVVGTLPGVLTQPDVFPGLPASRSEAVSLASDQNPVVLAAIHDLASDEFEIREQAAQLLPSFDVNAELSRNVDQSSADRTLNTLSLTGVLTVPIYQQGAVGSEIREARQSAAQSQRLVDQARRDAVEGATASWETYQSALAQIDARQDEVRATTIALEGVEQEAAVGSRTVLDVLDAEQELLDAQVNLVRAERDEVVARYDLLASVGGMTAADLQLGVTRYDPAAYYRAVRDAAYDFEVWNEIQPGLVGDAPLGE